MANESTYALISGLLPDIWEGALNYMQHSFVMPRYVTTYTDRTGMVARKVSEYEETGVTDNLGETSDLSPVEYDRDLLATLTPKEIGKQFLITDRRIESDSEQVILDATRDLGYTLGKKVESDLLSLVATFNGGYVGGSGSDMSLENLFGARSMLEAAAIPGPYYAVIHPYHYLDLFGDLTSLSNSAPLDVRNQAMSNYYVMRVADLDIIVSSLLPTVGLTSEQQTIEVTGTPTGGTFRLSLNNNETADIAYNANAAAVELALEALPNVGAGNATTTGTTTKTIVFDASLGNVKQLVLSDNSLTGGTTPTVDIATTVAGAKYADAGVFTRSAMALDLRRGLRIEPDRDPSLRSTELNATMIYAYGLWRPLHGVVVRADATSPNAT